MRNNLDITPRGIQYLQSDGPAVSAVGYVFYLSSPKVSRVHFHMGMRYCNSP